MEDPYGFIIPHCNYSSFQQDLFNNSLFIGEGTNLSPNPPPPSTAFDEICSGSIDDICSGSVDDDDDDDDVNAISICSAPDGGDLDGETPDLGFLQGSEMVEVLSDCKNQVNEVSEVDIESVNAREKRIPVEELLPPSICASVDTPLLVKTYPNPTTIEDGECLQKQIIELPVETNLLSDGHVPAAEVCIVDHESSRVEEKPSPVEEQSPSKIIRASVDSTVSVKTPSNQATKDEGDYSEEMEIDCPDETEEDMNMETEVYFVDSGDTVVLYEDYGEENVNQTNNVQFSDVLRVRDEDEGLENENETNSELSDEEWHEEDEWLEMMNQANTLEFSDVQQVQEVDEGLRDPNETNNVDLYDVQQVHDEDEGLESENETINVEFSDVQQVQEKEEGLENENGSKESAADNAEDPVRQGMLELPSWAFENGGGDNGEEEDDNLEQSMSLILELLDLLAEEELQYRNKNHGTGDFL